MSCLKAWKMRHAASMVFFGLAVLAAATAANATTITESFNSDPGWQGAGNTEGYNNFGYSDSNYAGGVTHEAGGAIASRTDSFDWYADNDLGTTYGLSSYLTASGKFTVHSVDGFDGGFEVGFFDPNDTTNKYEGGILHGLMMRILDYSSTQVRAQLRMASDRTSTMILDVGADYTFELNWDPTGYSAERGLATLTIRTAGGGLVGSGSVHNPNTDTTWMLSNFGITTLDFDADYTNGTEFYMDDLTYTHEVPEPASSALLSIALLSLLAYAWRKRK